MTAPSGRVVVVNVPMANFLMIDGRGDAASEAFQCAVRDPGGHVRHAAPVPPGGRWRPLRSDAVGDPVGVAETMDMWCEALPAEWTWTAMVAQAGARDTGAGCGPSRAAGVGPPARDSVPHPARITARGPLRPDRLRRAEPSAASRCSKGWSITSARSAMSRMARITRSTSPIFVTARSGRCAPSFASRSVRSHSGALASVHDLDRSAPTSSSSAVRSWAARLPPSWRCVPIGTAASW